ncbi:hypothetical protein F4809DRAFT_625556 [Biscogniauxia mediterranea]|nr:hypothetical protein F4809DRAFT_625556 [Biscogniauxia mediterranea]
MIVVSLIFGACHLIAWNWSFPSQIERLLWQVASIGSTVLPVLFPVVQVLRGAGEDLGRGRSYSRTMYRFRNWKKWLFYGLVVFPYFVCRIYLLVEVLAGLRDMPQGAYASVQWSNYLPHV